MLLLEPVVFGKNKLLSRTGANNFKKYFLAVGETVASSYVCEEGAGSSKQESWQGVSSMPPAARVTCSKSLMRCPSTPREGVFATH